MFVSINRRIVAIVRMSGGESGRILFGERKVQPFSSLTKKKVRRLENKTANNNEEERRMMG